MVYMLTWRERDITTLRELRDMMLSIADTVEAAAFVAAFREKWKQHTDRNMFLAAAFCDTSDQTVALLSRFSGRDCTGEFFVVRAPQDKWGNTGMGYCVMKVRLVDAGSGGSNMEILEPPDIATKWSRFSCRAADYQVVDGPARMLTRDEWETLTGFVYEKE